MFDVTCSSSGYKRGNNINVLNQLTDDIKYVRSYEDSGKPFQKKNLKGIAPNKNVTWNFVKHSGSATGSNGVLALNLPKSSLVIFYENPWSNYNFAGVCLYRLGAVQPT